MSWSPDGSKVAFDSDRDGNCEVYVVDADGSNQTNRTNSAAEDWVLRGRPRLRDRDSFVASGLLRQVLLLVQANLYCPGGQELRELTK